MKLFYSPASPYARKVRILLRELHLAVEEVLADPFANDPVYLALNPLNKIPCLVLDSGECLFDSDVVAAYLDTHSGRASLLPGGADRWHQEKLLSLASGLLDSAVALRVEKTKPGEQQSPLWGERHRSALSRGLGYLEQYWATVPAGLTLVAIVTGCALGYLDFRHPDIDWRTANPILADWFAEFGARPSFLATAPC